MRLALSAASAPRAATTGPVPLEELGAWNVQIAEHPGERLRPEHATRMAVGAGALAGAIGYKQRRRPLATEIRPEVVEKVDELPVAELGQPVRLERHQLHASRLRLPYVREQVGIRPEERQQIRRRLLAGRPLRCRADLWRERQPAGAGTLDRHGDLDWIPLPIGHVQHGTESVPAPFLIFAKPSDRRSAAPCAALR